jgi:hypothetical protein
MTAELHDGWLSVPLPAGTGDLARIELAVNGGPPVAALTETGRAFVRQPATPFLT